VAGGHGAERPVVLGANDGGIMGACAN